VVNTVTWDVSLYRDKWSVKLTTLRAGTVKAASALHGPGAFDATVPVASVLKDIKRKDLDRVDSILISEDGVQMFAGLVAAPTGYEIVETKAGETITWSGVDVFGLAANRCVIPDYTLPNGPWLTRRHVETGRASQVLGAFLNKHFGAQAAPGRGGIRVFVDPAGRNGTWGASAGETLLDVITRVADADLAVTADVDFAGGVSFRIRRRRDLTSSVLVAKHELEELRRRRVPRSVTHVWAITEQDGEERSRLVGSSFTNLDRVEQAIKSQPGELHQDARDVLDATAAAWSISAKMSTAGADRWKFNRHYRLGDFIAVMVDGDRIPVPVTGVSLEWTKGVASVKPVLGDATKDSLRLLIRRQNDIERSLRRDVV